MPSIDEMTAKLGKLARRNPRRYALGPPLDEARLADLERERGVRLPPGYRAFLSGIGDGGAGPYFGLLPLERAGVGPGGVLARSFPLTRLWNPDHSRGNRLYREKDDYPLPAGSLPLDGCLVLCSQGCGTRNLLVVKGAEPDQVWIDLIASGGGICPLRQDFLTWYDEWLDEQLAL